VLSETFTLRQNLEISGFDLPQDHPDVKQPGKSPGYRVCLGEGGLPVEIEEIDAETMSGLWTIREGKHNSFPVVKVQHALLSVPLDDPIRDHFKKLKKHQASERIGLLRQVFDSFPIHLSSKDEHVWKRLRQKAIELSSVFSEEDPRYQALPTMLRRFNCPDVDSKQLLAALANLLISQLVLARLSDAIMAENILIGKIDPKDPLAKAEVPIVLDAAGSSYPIAVASPRMKVYVNRCLSAQTNDTEADERGRCALSGTEQPLLTDRSPEPNLPLLGETKLFSMNESTPCQQRYGLTGMRVVPVGQRTATDLQNALKFITGAELKGRTWRSVASGRFESGSGAKREQPDLLIVYVEGQPVIDANVADFFGADSQQVQKQFTIDAKAVCEALEGIAKERPESKLNLLILRKADKEKKQIVLSDSPTVREVLAAAQWWQQAATNVPNVSLPFLGKNGEPHIPYPDQVVRLLSEEWIRNGTRSNKVRGIDLSEVLDLMLRKPGKWEAAAQHLLDLTLSRLISLLLGLFGVIHKPEGKKHWEDYPNESREVALKTVSVLGILLDALNSKKEVYMKESAFQIGQMLSLADTLHKDYCIAVRNASLPPSLIGNAMMPRAIDNPLQALADLADRMRVYTGWAKVAQEPSGEGKEAEEKRIAVREARKTLRRYQSLATRLHKLELPQYCDDLMKAHLLLGYLASPKTIDINGTSEEEEPGNE
jgi:hypothetical protein